MLGSQSIIDVLNRESFVNIVLCQRNVTVKDILCCIIIIISPFRDVFPLIRDGIGVFGHVKYWGKTFVVSRVSSTHKILLKCIFESPKEVHPWQQGEDNHVGLLGISVD